MDEEIKTLERNKTWLLIELCKGQKLIGLKSDYKLMYKLDGSIQKYKRQFGEEQRAIAYASLTGALVHFSVYL